MKYGYLEFRYGKRRDGQPGSTLPRDISINIGDNIQSIAVRNLFRRIGIADGQVIGIDRDSLATYAGEPVSLLMNGCFYQRCFPLPPQVTPLFFGFNTPNGTVIRKHRALFEKHQPIGCRDTATMMLFRKHRISAYVTGCSTLTLDTRSGAAGGSGVIISHGKGSGEFPGALLESMPPSLLSGAEFIYQRQTVRMAPLGELEVAAADETAARYLDRYRNASLVVTPLLHVASPCLGMGVPVILARKGMDDRFTSIDRLTPVYVPEIFKSIDWSPAAPAMAELKTHMANCVRQLIDSGKPEPSTVGYFDATYSPGRLKTSVLPEPNSPPRRTLGGLLRKLTGRA